MEPSLCQCAFVRLFQTVESILETFSFKSDSKRLPCNVPLNLLTVCVCVLLTYLLTYLALSCVDLPVLRHNGTWLTLCLTLCLTVCSYRQAFCSGYVLRPKRQQRVRGPALLPVLD